MKFVDVRPIFKALSSLTELQVEYLQMKVGNEEMQKLALHLCGGYKDIFDKLLEP